MTLIRPWLTTTLILLAAGPARGDIAPPPWLKRVDTDYQIETDRAYPDWVFFTVGGDKITRVRIDPAHPLKIQGAGRAGSYRICQLVAVPRAEVEKYTSQEELNKAISDYKMPGLQRADESFDSYGTVNVADRRDTIVVRYKLVALDPVTGLVLHRLTSDREPSFSWAFVGLTAVGMITAGVWLVRRRRKVHVS